MAARLITSALALITLLLSPSILLAAQNSASQTGQTASTSQQSAQPSQSGSSGSSITFDLHNDSALDIGPPDARLTKNVALLCFKAQQVNTATQPIIVKASTKTDLDQVYESANRAMSSFRDELTYYRTYAELPEKIPSYFDSTVSTNNGRQLLLRVEEGERKLRDALKDLERARREGQRAFDAREWARYESSVVGIKAAVDKFATPIQNVRTAKANYSPVVKPGTDPDGNVSALLSGIVRNVDAIEKQTAAQVSDLTNSPAMSAIPAIAQHCTDPSGVAPMVMGMDLYVRLDFSAIDEEVWNDLRAATLTLSASAGSPMNPTPIRAGIAQPTTTVPGNVGFVPSVALVVAAPPTVLNQLKHDLPADCSVPIDQQVQAIRANYGVDPAAANVNGRPWADVLSGLSPVLPRDCRPSLEREAARLRTVGQGSRVKYFKWPYPLSGDTNVSVAVSVLYTPPLSPGPRDEGRYYPVGSVVAVQSCFRSLQDRNKAVPGTDPAWWTSLLSCNPAIWDPSVHYAVGSLIQDQGICYTAESDPMMGTSPSGDMAWKNTPACGTATWVTGPEYSRGIIVMGPAPTCYEATQPGIGLHATWLLLPSCPTLNQLATSEESLALVSQTLPTVHSLSRFNLAAAVVYSSITNRSFGFSPVPSTTTIENPCSTSVATVGTGNNATQVTTQYNCVQTGATHIIDPVLFVTYYPWPIDAERPYNAWDLRPGVSLGISISAPSSNFYLGLTHEIRRNVQLVYGFTVAKVAHLAKQGLYNASPTGSGATPLTVQRFDKGAYVGLSFDILGFIQSLSSSSGASH